MNIKIFLSFLIGAISSNSFLLLSSYNSSSKLQQLVVFSLKQQQSSDDILQFPRSESDCGTMSISECRTKTPSECGTKAPSECGTKAPSECGTKAPSDLRSSYGSVKLAPLFPKKSSRGSLAEFFDKEGNPLQFDNTSMTSPLRRQISNRL
ncbi:hypothetical protein HYV11_02810 [Candidatus Dependentiae bacterium]|nr:hypothetical protein [Candidatus Dependentiae bacterium]